MQPTILSGTATHHNLLLGFFTTELRRAAYEDERWDEVRRAKEHYVEHLESIRSAMPANVLSIADPGFVDDALVAKLRQSDEIPLLQLVLRCNYRVPNIPADYFDLTLNYVEPEISDIHLRNLLDVAMSVRTSPRHDRSDAWCHEFDLLPDGRLEHNIIFHSPLAVVIRFRRIEIARVDRPNRDLPRYTRRYRVDRFKADSSKP